jgi:hypothetical protein
MMVHRQACSRILHSNPAATDGSMNEWIDIRMDRWMDEWIVIRMERWMDERSMKIKWRKITI